MQIWIGIRQNAAMSVQMSVQQNQHNCKRRKIIEMLVVYCANCTVILSHSEMMTHLQAYSYAEDHRSIAWAVP